MIPSRVATRAVGVVAPHPGVSTSQAHGAITKSGSTVFARSVTGGDRPFVAVQGATGSQGAAYLLAALRTSGKHGHEVHAIVRKPQDFAEMKLTLGGDSMNVSGATVHANPKALAGREGVFINATTFGGLGPTLDQLPRDPSNPTKVLKTQNGIDLGAGNREGLTVEDGISVFTTTRKNGVVTINPGGKIQVGADNRFLADVRKALEGSGVFDLEIVPDIRATKWQKLALNCALNAPATVFGATLGQLLEDMKTDPRVDKLIGGIVTEVCNVALAQAVQVKPADQQIADIKSVMAKNPQHPTSMQVAFKNNETLELPVLNAGVAAKGQDLEVPTPLNALVSRMVGELESLREAHGVSPDFHRVHGERIAQIREELLQAAASLY